MVAVMRKLGFTGTQLGLTEQQLYVIKTIIPMFTEFHHGDCIGADAQAAEIADKTGKHIVCHPPINTSKRAYAPCHETREPLEYLARNREIVRETDNLLACPREYEEVLRSGTWATIRAARARNKFTIIVFPNGSVREETNAR